MIELISLQVIMWFLHARISSWIDMFGVEPYLVVPNQL
jgi:hypothetical protein